MIKNKCLLACLLALLLSVCAAWGQPARAQEGLTKISNNVYAYLDVKNAGPANSFGANAGIIIGKNGIAVVDTLISAKEAKRFIKDIRAVSDKPITYVINTHYHLDHSFGNCEFVKLGAAVVGQANDKNDAQNHCAAVLKGAANYGLTPEDMEGTTIALPSLCFTERMEIDLGDQVVQLIYVKPSHTRGSILVYLPDQKILFTGDVLFTNYHSFLAEGDLKNWLKTLDFISALDARKIIPGHGPLSTQRDVQDMKKYLVLFDRKARRLSAKSKDIDQVASLLKKELPPRAEGEFLIKGNLQMKYMGK